MRTQVLFTKSEYFVINYPYNEELSYQNFISDPRLQILEWYDRYHLQGAFTETQRGKKAYDHLKNIALKRYEECYKLLMNEGKCVFYFPSFGQIIEMQLFIDPHGGKLILLRFLDNENKLHKKNTETYSELTKMETSIEKVQIKCDFIDKELEYFDNDIISTPWIDISPIVNALNCLPKVSIHPKEFRDLLVQTWLRDLDIAEFISFNNNSIKILAGITENHIGYEKRRRDESYMKSQGTKIQFRVKCSDTNLGVMPLSPEVSIQMIPSSKYTYCKQLESAAKIIEARIALQ